MKKLTLMAIAMGMLAFTACTEKKPAAAPAAQVEKWLQTPHSSRQLLVNTRVLTESASLLSTQTLQ